EALVAWRASVTEAGNGEEAVAELLRAQQAGTPYALILLDRHMPGMDGLQVAEYIQHHTTLKGITILMLTSDNRAGDIARSRQLGVNAYLVKPITRSALLESI